MTAARTAPRGRPPRRTRAGFTLLELLGVILIIAILIAIAFPAYQSIMANTRTTVARAEMTAINSAIADFKSRNNIEPPSYVSFVAANPAALPAGTKAVLRQMFPSIDLTAASPVMGSLTTAGVWGNELRGSEALVFFLGGVRRVAGSAPTPDEKELVGFSKNPANPFAQPAAGQSTRIGPFYEFDTGRLIDTETTPDGLLEYRDDLPGQTKPLLYLSTAATGGYRKTDLNGTQGLSATWEPYKKSATAYYNPSTYQLISAGSDGQYGNGGVYDPDNTASLAPEDADNLTNFSDGLLGG